MTTEVIEHVENPWFFVRELYRITRPGGVVVLSTPNLANVYTRAWYVLTGRLYNFLESAYNGSGHITPVYLWNLKRMIESKFDLEEVGSMPAQCRRRSFACRLALNFSVSALW